MKFVSNKLNVAIITQKHQIKIKDRGTVQLSGRQNSVQNNFLAMQTRPDSENPNLISQSKAFTQPFA